MIILESKRNAVMIYVSLDVRIRGAIVLQLREIAKQRDIILLNDSINSDIGDVNQPLSQAWLLKSYVEGLYPYEDIYRIIAESYIEPQGRKGWRKKSS